VSEHVVCSLGDLPAGTARRFVLDDVAVAVVRCDGDVFAVGDRCTHQDVSLSEGEVDCDERTIECWKHGSTFSLETGEALALPATKPTPVFDARVEGGQIVVRVP